jgi:hypothetical protein
MQISGICHAASAILNSLRVFQGNVDIEAAGIFNTCAALPVTHGLIATAAAVTGAER